MANDLGKSDDCILDTAVETSLEISASSSEAKELSPSDKCSNIFIIYDHKGKIFCLHQLFRSLSDINFLTAKNNENVLRMRKELKHAGYKIYCYDGEPFKSKTLASSSDADDNILPKSNSIQEISSSTITNSKIDQNIIDGINKCAVVVCAVSKEFRYNHNCKDVALFARDLKRSNPSTGPELLFSMMQGDYTTQSSPFRVDGWLGHLMKDALWYPAWSRVHIAGASEATVAVISLKKKQIVLGEIQDDIWQERAKKYASTHEVFAPPPTNVPKSPIVLLMDKIKSKKVIQKHVTPLNHNLAFR